MPQIESPPQADLLRPALAALLCLPLEHPDVGLALQLVRQTAPAIVRGLGTRGTRTWVLRITAARSIELQPMQEPAGS